MFIVSEALFFMTIFWAFFHSALLSSLELRAQWSPKNIDSINSFKLSLLNIVILLLSDFTVIYIYYSLIQGNRKEVLNDTVLTVVLALIFIDLQGLEYTVSSFTLFDSTYSFYFYFGTGFYELNNVVSYIIIYILLKTKEIYINNKLLIYIASNFSCSSDFSSSLFSSYFLLFLLIKKIKKKKRKKIIIKKLILIVYKKIF